MPLFPHPNDPLPAPSPVRCAADALRVFRLALTLPPQPETLAFLLDGRNHVPRVRRFEGHDVELIDMPYGERNIWGATADMLLTLYRLLRGEDA